MKVWDSWGNLFGKTLWVVAMGLLLTGCAGPGGADSNLQLGQSHEEAPDADNPEADSLPQLVQRYEEALNAADFIKAQNALCAPSTTRRLERNSGPSEYPVVVQATAQAGPTPTITPYPTNWAVPWVKPGPGLYVGDRVFGIPTSPKAAEAENATRTVRATQQAADKREEGPQPTFEIRDVEPIITDKGAQAEILLGIYADGGSAGRDYFILYALPEEDKWWVDCDRR